MSDRVDFYFRQRVSEAEMDLAFDQLEQADRDLAADLNIRGIVCGAVPTEHSPVADLSVDLTGPARAYDRLGRRIFIATDQRVALSADLNGRETRVNAAGNEKWLSVSLAFDRKLSDPRTDGSSNKVFFRRDESFRTVVRQAPEMPEGTRLMAELAEDEVLVCDVRLVHGQSQVRNHDIELSRRQSFVFAGAGAVSVEPGLWTVLAPASPTVQDSLDAADGWMAGRAAALASSGASAPGASLVGAAEIQGTAFSVPAGTVQGQMEAVAQGLDAHVGSASGAHPASAISATPVGVLASTDVQSQIGELLTALASQSQVRGGALVGEAALKGEPYSVIAGTVRSQLSKLLSIVNEHALGGDHDGRYLRVLFSSSEQFAAGEEKAVATLDVEPALVTVAYTPPSQGETYGLPPGAPATATADATTLQELLATRAKVLRGPLSDRLYWHTEAVLAGTVTRAAVLGVQAGHGASGGAAAHLQGDASATHPASVSVTPGGAHEAVSTVTGGTSIAEQASQMIQALVASANTRLFVKNGSPQELTLHVTAWG